MSPSPRTFADQLAIEPLGPDEYVSKELPGRMGNAMPIAYGGCTLSIATRAACATVSETHSLYSILGHFLGPASTTQKLLCTVHRRRDTKTFATRRVEVKQEQPDGTIRVCMEVLADFHVQEPALQSYHVAPKVAYKGPHTSPTVRDLAQTALSQGLIDEGTTKKHAAAFGMQNLFFDTRTCVEGMAGQNLVGSLKHQPTDQDDLPVTSRVSGDWSKTRVPLTHSGEKAAALSFLMDGGLAFLPLTHDHMWLDDAGPTSTLDFALRLFVPVVDLGNWHLRERKTIAAGCGRSYSEARLWDEQGVLVASMTQQCILRPKAQGKDVKASL